LAPLMKTPAQQEGGREVRYYNEPATTFGRRVSTWLIGLLPIKGEL